MLAVLKNPNVDIIAHPTNLLHNYNVAIPSAMKKEIAKSANEHDKIFEINIRYNVPDEEFIKLLKENSATMIIGSDSHDAKELEKIWKIKTIQKVFK